ncbi:MAG: hypothetical protein IPO39_18000 [Bacteroidetes bacterium]|nr:hypothetical protein [Bacteroidota bacterium]MBK9526551.1 hypothetical protein [Bacteroidota bacterium]MBK9542638.1 hypothetical protein [Bacteroidota bacterium]MBP6401559.1 hypothetical protein [Bacteroidia bacterium]MBP6650325.1 hypothetical protein [Bacteroidia bacterium]
MKSVLKLLILFLLPALSFAQKDVSICDTLKADLDSGIVNKLKPDAPFDSLKKYFPCYTEEISEDGDSKCGGGLLYDRLNFAAFTQNDYFEFRKGFIGILNYQLFGHDEEYLQSILGEPVRVTDVQEFDGAPMQTVFFYKKMYGFLLVWLDADHKIFKLQMHSKDLDKIELCF